MKKEIIKEKINMEKEKIYEKLGEFEINNSNVNVEILNNIIKKANELGSNYINIVPVVNSYYETESITFIFYLERLETDEEFNIRIDKFKKNNELKNDIEYMEYLRLKEKFKSHE